jgi:branched-chain amino acid transport system substrate-binding protein
MGIEVVMDETYTPPLSDATPLIQRVRSAQPEMLLFISSNIPDLKLGLEKLNEFQLGDIPVIGNGTHNGAPEVLNNIAPELLDGMMFVVAD